MLAAQTKAFIEARKNGVAQWRTESNYRYLQGYGWLGVQLRRELTSL